ncbi:MAG: PfkB family carbohydrate kinase [Candidatus Avoscillospira sp.]
MAKIVTFGELMLRLQPYNYERFVQCDHVEFTFGGGEANVAVSLANYGMNAAYVTKLPAHAIGQAAVNSLRRYGVDTSKIVRGGNRVGIYFNEKGASQRGSVCIYDRAHSAIQEADPAEFDWDTIFEGVDWFHFTGITPALGPNMVQACEDACKAAKARGVKISCDLNYRGKLWTRAQAREAMTKLCQYVDVCISNEEDAKDVFGIEAEATDIYGGKLNREGYKSVARQLADRFVFEMVAITLRESHSAFDNGWSAMLYNVAQDEYCFSKKYDLHIIDRIGGGDSFGGGLIYSLLSGKDTQAAVEFAVAASALKHSIEGDYNMVTVAEVEKLAGGDGSGRVQR